MCEVSWCILTEGASGNEGFFTNTLVLNWCLAVVHHSNIKRTLILYGLSFILVFIVH